MTLNTASSLSLLDVCPTRHRIVYQDMITPLRKVNVNLAIGSLVHFGLECYWKKMPIGKIIDEMRVFAVTSKEYAEFWGDEENYFHLIKCVIYVEGYYRRWFETDWVDNSYEDIRPELKFQTTFGGHVYQGKKDVQMLDGAHKVHIKEHKTASSSAQDITSVYWTQLSLNTQVSLYIEDAKAKHPDKEVTFEYDVIIKTKSKPLKGRATRRKGEGDESLQQRRDAKNETLEEYCERLRGIYLADEPEEPLYIRKQVFFTEDEHEENKRQINLKSALTADSGYLEVKNFQGCNSYNTPCPFLGVCIGYESLDDSSLFERRDHIFPELEGDNNGTKS